MGVHVTTGERKFASPSSSLAAAVRAPWLPPLASVQAFIAAANHLCFTKAANEIGITQSGVSRSIRSIEETVGSLLFERTGHGLVLTEAGQIYFAKVRRIVSELEDATYSLSAYGTDQQQLTISTLPSFGCFWLAIHIPEFAKMNPSISIEVIARIEPFEFEKSGVDIAIRFGTLDWPGAFSEFLMTEDLIPVCSPRMLDPRSKPTKEILLKVPLVQHTHRRNAWREWFNEVGIDHPRASAGLCFEQYNMGLQAALNGAGAALLPTFMVEESVKAGHLVQLYDQPQKTPWCYSLVYPEKKRANQAIRKFRRWIKAELRKSLLKQHCGT